MQLYARLEKAARANDPKQVRETAAQLMEKYGSTAYGPMAALAAAKANYEAGDAAGAATQLQWVVEHARDDDVVAVARLRLAGVLLDQKKYDEALKLLEAAHPEAFEGLFADRTRRRLRRAGQARRSARRLQAGAGEAAGGQQLSRGGADQARRVGRKIRD